MAPTSPGAGAPSIWRARCSLYLNIFVLVVQGFQKIGFLTRFAPTGTELPFFAAQGIALALFFTLAVRAIQRPTV